MLVTGATGSVGPAVVEAALAAGWAVRVLEHRTPTADRFGDRVDVVTGDIVDAGAMRSAVAGCDVVVHLAGVAHRTGPAADLEHATVTREGATTVFAAAEAAGCDRVVFASSISVYGRDGTFHEASPLRPVNAYGEAKVAAEADLGVRRNSDGRPLGTVVRLATCYGPGAAGNVATMLDALGRRRFLLAGDGTNRKSLVHVDDAASAIVLAASSPDAAGETYDVSDGRPLPLRAIVATMCDHLGRPPPPRIPVGPLSIAARAASVAAGAVGRRSPVDAATIDTLVADVAVPAVRIRRDLGFASRFDLEAGLTTMDRIGGDQR